MSAFERTGRPKKRRSPKHNPFGSAKKLQRSINELDDSEDLTTFVAIMTAQARAPHPNRRRQSDCLPGDLTALIAAQVIDEERLRIGAEIKLERLEFVTV